MATQISENLTTAVNDIYKRLLNNIIIGVLPEQAADSNTMLDMLDDLTRPGSIISFVRKHQGHIEQVYNALPEHMIADQHVNFGQFAFILWFSFHSVEVDLAFST